MFCLTQESPLTSSWAPHEKSLSPSARFQVLLVHARRSSSIHGMYESMLARYVVKSCGDDDSSNSTATMVSHRLDAFAGLGTASIRAKMVDFIIASLHEDSVQCAREMLLMVQQRATPTALEIEEQFERPASAPGAT